MSATTDPPGNAGGADREFLLAEFSHVNDHMNVIHTTRDRFFAQFVTVILGLYGVLGLAFGGFKGSVPVTSPTTPAFFLLLLTTSALLLGFGLLFAIAGNALARDYYRQRRGRLAKLLARVGGVTQDDVESYFRFSRDQTVWRYRAGSVYSMYSVFISAINAINCWVVLFLLGLQCHLAIISISIVCAVAMQQLMCVYYLRAYTSKPYREH